MSSALLTNPDCDVPDFTRPPWDETILVMLRNRVHTRWNGIWLSEHCRKTGQIRYEVYALDSSKKQALSRENRLALAQLKLDETGGLPNKIDLAIGMKAMIIQNMATNAGLANGS